MKILPTLIASVFVLILSTTAFAGYKNMVKMKVSGDEVLYGGNAAGKKKCTMEGKVNVLDLYGGHVTIVMADAAHPEKKSSCVNETLIRVEWPGVRKFMRELEK